MTSRRRLPLAIKRGNRDAERVREQGSGVSGDLLEPGLDSVDLEIANVSEVSEVLSTQLLSDSNLLDSSRNETRFIRHSPRLSEIDRYCNDLSPIHVQARDSVGAVAQRFEMSRAEVEAWMQRLDVDWERVIREAGIPEGQRYVVPDRWGKNPRQMSKVFSALDRLEKRRPAPTEEGARLKRLTEWEEIGRAISRVPEVFARELERLRPIAAAATKIAEGEEARATLLSLTPAPSRPRK